eukprot:3634820-Rhodomonas_salina.3
MSENRWKAKLSKRSGREMVASKEWRRESIGKAGRGPPHVCNGLRLRGLRALKQRRVHHTAHALIHPRPDRHLEVDVHNLPTPACQQGNDQLKGQEKRGASEKADPEHRVHGLHDRLCALLLQPCLLRLPFCLPRPHISALAANGANEGGCEAAEEGTWRWACRASMAAIALGTCGGLSSFLITRFISTWRCVLTSCSIFSATCVPRTTSVSTARRRAIAQSHGAGRTSSCRISSVRTFVWTTACTTSRTPGAATARVSALAIKASALATAKAASSGGRAIRGRTAVPMGRPGVSVAPGVPGALGSIAEDTDTCLHHASHRVITEEEGY